MRTSILVLACIAISMQPARAATATYDVGYDGGKVIHVSAHLPAGDGRLLVAQRGGIDHLPDEWATFIHNLRATSPDGTAVTVTSKGKEGWLSSAASDVNVTYDVVLDYAVGQWPAGNEQSGRIFTNALYTVTKPLFITTSGVTDAEVDFHIPATWQAATPWDALGANRFQVHTPSQLTMNTIVLGIFPSAKILVG